MAERLAPGATYDQLHHFVAAGVMGMRHRWRQNCSFKADRLVGGQRCGCWWIDDTALPKKGKHSGRAWAFAICSSAPGQEERQLPDAGITDASPRGEGAG